MIDDLKTTLTALNTRVAAERESGDAQRFSQAVCNIANAMRVLADVPHMLPDKPQKSTDIRLEVSAAQVEHMVSRFLGWKLPPNFRPDNGISFDPVINKGHEFESRRVPSGTNLFDADQARAMVWYMLVGLPQA
jgi:hypothetical protein